MTARSGRTPGSSPIFISPPAGLARRQSKARRLLLRQRLGQDEPAEGEVHRGQDRRRHEGRARVEPAEEPAQERPEDEAHPEPRRDQAEILRPFAGVRDVGHEGERGRMRRRRHARDEPARKQEPDGARHRHHHVIRRHDRHGDEQDGPPPEPVRQRADGGGEAELHDRVGRREDAAPKRGVGDRDAAHLGDEVRHDRQDQPDAHGVERDGDHDEDDRQPHGTPGRCQATVNLD
jgi:hypothetical protein